MKRWSQWCLASRCSGGQETALVHNCGECLLDFTDQSSSQQTDVSPASSLCAELYISLVHLNTFRCKMAAHVTAASVSWPAALVEGHSVQTEWEGVATGHQVLDLKVQEADREAQLLHYAGVLPGRQPWLLLTAQTHRGERGGVRTLSWKLSFSTTTRQTDLLAPVQTIFPDW